MLLIISILFITIAIMKFYGFNIIRRIKKIDTDRTENKKKYDRIISLSCVLVGMVFGVFSSDWFYALESNLLLDASYVVLFIAIVLVLYAPIIYREGIVGAFLSRIESSAKKRKVICRCYIVDAILAVMLIICKVIKCTDYGIPLEFYFLGLDTAIVVFICTLLIIISLLFIVAVTLHKKKVIVITTIVIALVAFNVSLFICAFTTGGDYYTFSSPDRKHSIVIEEWAFLMGEGINVYERENMFFIRKLGTLSGDSQNGYYPIEWKENKVIITSNMGTENEEICEFVLKNKKRFFCS